MHNTFFDAHLDLACLAVNGRDMLVPVDQLTDSGLHKIGCFAPPGVTLPELQAANVRFILGTIFTETDGDDAEGYPAGDAQLAHTRGRAQLEAYLTWQDAGIINLDLFKLLQDDPCVGEIRGGMGAAEPIPFDLAKKLAHLNGSDTIHAGILIENADPIRDPDELPWWIERGVVAVGMAWWKPSRYATGNGNPTENKQGLTDLGRALVKQMDAHRVVHDQSHLSDASTRELFETSDAPVIASHSNCRALLGGESNPHFQRHLPDEFIKQIAERKGVIGLNLVRNFIKPDLSRDTGDRPSIADALDHVEHICSIAGHNRAVGIGTDMDGGITCKDLPEGIERPSHLIKLAEGLHDRGWSDHDIAGFTHRNWLNFFRRAANAR
jgi:membrane dipeptidase